ncbi:MAG: CAP domain-containing protein [Ruminococcus sp.]|nr:CAP domain-containing protein [Ruminococcus sp.]
MKKRTVYACISSAAVMFLSAYGVAMLGRTEKSENLLPSVTSGSLSAAVSRTEMITEEVTYEPVSIIKPVTFMTLPETTMYRITVPETSSELTESMTEGVSSSSSVSQSQTPLTSEVTESTYTVKTNETENTTTETEYVTDEMTDYHGVILALVNEARRAEGIGELSASASLDKAADIRAGEISIIFGHTRPDERSWFSVCEEVGVSPEHMGENIAAGISEPSEVVNAWMNSPDHRASIMNPDFTMLGTGCYEADDQNGYYWVQIFAG